jgi:hypothetical protein
LLTNLTSIPGIKKFCSSRPAVSGIQLRGKDLYAPARRRWITLRPAALTGKGDVHCLNGASFKKMRKANATTVESHYLIMKKPEYVCLRLDPAGLFGAGGCANKRGAGVIKIRFYGEISHKNVLGKGRVRQSDAKKGGVD